MRNDPPIFAPITPLQDNQNAPVAQTDSRIKLISNRSPLKKSNGQVKSIADVVARQRKRSGYSEEHLQIALANHLNAVELTTKSLKWFHVPNGGKRNVVVAQKLKAQGVKRGVPDACILIPGKVIFIELKAEHGTLSPEQKQFRQDVTDLDHKYYLVKAANPIDVIQQVNVILRENGVV